jgi:hypothetical protein
MVAGHQPPLPGRKQHEKFFYENAATGPPWKSSLRPSGQQLQRQTVFSLQTAARL